MNNTDLLSQLTTNIFEEDDDPSVPLAELPATRFCEDLGDGRGYTCNIPRRLANGYTTVDEEVVACIENYTKRVPGNHLAPLLPTLRHLRDEGSDDTKQLDALDFVAHWRNACSNPEFVKAYAEVADSIFGKATRAHLAELKLMLPVACSILFDSVIQHGNGDDPDGVPAMLDRVASDWSSVEIIQNPLDFLEAFLEVRLQTLENPHNRETAKEWGKSTSRVDALKQLLRKNPQLHAPLHFFWEGKKYEVPN